jgi:hypothetical protein
MSMGQELGDGGDNHFVFGIMTVKHLLLLRVQFAVVFYLDQGFFFDREIEFDAILIDITGVLMLSMVVHDTILNFLVFIVNTIVNF